MTDLEEQLRDISPIYFVSQHAPPLLLIYGDSDKTVPLQQSKVMRKKHDDLRTPVNLIVKPRGGHTYWPGIAAEYEEVTGWFDKYLDENAGVTTARIAAPAQ